jgi:hypothetical protein
LRRGSWTRGGRSSGWKRRRRGRSAGRGFRHRRGSGHGWDDFRWAQRLVLIA